MSTVWSRRTIIELLRENPPENAALGCVLSILLLCRPKDADLVSGSISARPISLVATFPMSLSILAG